MSSSKLNIKVIKGFSHSDFYESAEAYTYECTYKGKKYYIHEERNDEDYNNERHFFLKIEPNKGLKELIQESRPRTTELEDSLYPSTYNQLLNFIESGRDYEVSGKVEGTKKFVNGRGIYTKNVEAILYNKMVDDIRGIDWMLDEKNLQRLKEPKKEINNKVEILSAEKVDKDFISIIYKLGDHYLGSIHNFRDKDDITVVELDKENKNLKKMINKTSLEKSADVLCKMCSTDKEVKHLENNLKSLGYDKICESYKTFSNMWKDKINELDFPTLEAVFKTYGSCLKDNFSREVKEINNDKKKDAIVKNVAKDKLAVKESVNRLLNNSNEQER